MKHQMLTMRLPDGLLDAYRDMSLDSRKAALEAMRQALHKSCRTRSSRVATVNESLTTAPDATEPAQAPAEPAVVPAPEPAPNKSEPEPAPDDDMPENPFPALIKNLAEGW